MEEKKQIVNQIVQAMLSEKVPLILKPCLQDTLQHFYESDLGRFFLFCNVSNNDI